MREGLKNKRQAQVLRSAADLNAVRPVLKQERDDATREAWIGVDAAHAHRAPCRPRSMAFVARNLLGGQGVKRLPQHDRNHPGAQDTHS